MGQLCDQGPEDPRSGAVVKGCDYRWGGTSATVPNLSLGIPWKGNGQSQVSRVERLLLHPASIRVGGNAFTMWAYRLHIQ